MAYLRLVEREKLVRPQSLSTRCWRASAAPDHGETEANASDCNFWMQAQLDAGTSDQ